MHVSSMWLWKEIEPLLFADLACSLCRPIIFLTYVVSAGNSKVTHVLDYFFISGVV